MNGQYLCNRQITVSYAYKKDTKGERHGTPAGQISHLFDAACCNPIFHGSNIALLGVQNCKTVH